MSTTRAVVLARGLGTRMRVADPAALLTPEQRLAADAGLKPMMPVNGRPFLDYVLSGLADAGIADVALVVAPDHDVLRSYYATAPPARVALSFVVQRDPRGTADALLAAEPWAAGGAFLVLNADNLYPARAVQDLARLDEPGLPAFDAEDLVGSGNIPRDRVRTFAVIDVDAGGYLTGIVEKPQDDPMAVIEPETAGAGAGRRQDALISMNCWRFDARIFDACRDVRRSARGELELPEAVSLAVRRGVPFKTFRAFGPVLDLSRRGDTADLERRLAGIVPRP